MPRNQAANGRVELRPRPEDKAMLVRAAALERLDLSGFILRAALQRAQAAIEEAETHKMSERDTQRVFELLENPPAPPARLRRAAKAGCILE
jgi:uncharacterized protein (DUF1778 family)